VINSIQTQTAASCASRSAGTRLFALLASILLLAACSKPAHELGEKGDGSDEGPPDGLNYAVNPATYLLGETIPSNTIKAAFGAPAEKFAISPALPAGLTFDTATAQISGSPSAISAEKEYIVTAYNAWGSRFVRLRLEVMDIKAKTFRFDVQPTSAVAGTAIAPAIVVSAILDDGVSVDTEFTRPVTLSFQNNAGSGTIGGTKTVSAVAGVATFNNVSVDKVGTGYTLKATFSPVAPQTSAAFNITPAAATKVKFAVQPSNAVAGVSIAPSVQVGAYDAYDNLDTNYTGNITVAIGTNAGGGTLSGTLTVAAVAGVASFSNLSIEKSGTGYTLAASSGALTGATSTAFNVAAAAATHLGFSVQPSNTLAGAVINAAPRVVALDAFENLATAFAGNITVAIGTNPGASSLSGTAILPAVTGQGVFSNLSLNKVGVGYTLTASAGGLTGVTSSSFNITAGAATKIKFTVQPTNTVAAAAITPAVAVTAYDTNDNIATGFTGNIVIALGTNPGAGTLSGTKTVAAISGVATFSTLNINKSGVGYTLAATSSGLTGETSSTFDIVAGSATQIKFTVQPSNTVAGSSISPAVQVTAYDAGMNVDTTYAGNITVTFGTNAGAGTLSGTTSVAAVAGVASFSNLSIDKAATGYTLTTTAGGLTGETSTGFNITPATAVEVKFTAQPTNTAASTAITPAVQVSAYDTYGNIATGFAGNVTVAIGTNPGAGTLSGTVTVAATSGVASFSTLKINKVGTGYTLAASSGGLAGESSTAFDITAAPASQLKFVVQPTNAVAVTNIAPAVEVRAYDADMNLDPNYIANITIAIGTNPGSGTLSGTKTIAAVGGVASFSGLNIDKSGTGYTLTAASGALTGDTSAAFNITAAAATKLKFTVQPTNTPAGSSIAPAVKVTAYDPNDNIDLSYAGNITVAIGTNAGGGTLSGTATVAASSGVATFSNLSIEKVGTGYTLTTSSGALTADTSSTFNIVPGAATQLAFTVQPSNAVAAVGISPAMQITVYDAYLNVATTYASNVTLAISTNPGSGTLSGTASVAPVNGIATFTGLSINKSGTGYRLSASSGALTGDTSAAFNITAAPATQLVFSTQPTGTVAATSISPAVSVSAVDANLNLDLTYSAGITVAIGTNPSGGVLSGTLTAAASSGVASFSNLKISLAGVGYTLTAASGALTGATSAAFNISAGPATQLKFTAQPTSATAGSSIAPAITVTAYDAAMNVDTAFSGNITIAIGTNPGSGSLSGTATVAASSGVATFSNLSINKAGTGYTLTASSGALATDTSSAFNISAGSATQVKFSVQPTDAVAATSISPAVVVTAYDANLNVVTGYSANITVAIGMNPGSGTLSGTATVAASSGVATFSNLSINKAGTGYTLTASSGALTGDTSSAFNISAGAAAKVAFTVQPANAFVNNPISPAVQVTAQDAQDNMVTGYSGNITVAIGTNPAGGVLSGTVTVAAVNGVSSFNDLAISQVGTGYTLTASSGLLTGATSTTFDVLAVTPTKLIFNVEPSNATDCTSISPAVKVYAVNASNVLATDYSGNVTVAFGTNAGSGTLSGTLTVAASGGIATFSDLSVDKPANGYTLSASSGALTAATSAAFNILPGAVASLAFTTQPTSSRPTAAISPSIAVTAYDACAGGQVVNTFAGNITLSLATNPPTATLGGTLTRAASAGVATFNNITISKSSYSASGAYSLQASDGTRTATSSAFNVGIDLVAPVELIDSGVSSSNAGAITFGRSETGFDSSKYDGTLTYSSEAICQNTDSVARNVTIVDQAGTSRGSISVPATGTLTRVTGTFAPIVSVTSLKVKLDQTTSANQLRCHAIRALVRQQYASKTRLYYPMTSLAYNFSSNVDRNDTTTINGTTTPIGYNSGASALTMTNAERIHRIQLDTAAIGNTVVGYAFEAVCSADAANRAVAILYNTTTSVEVLGTQTTSCPNGALGLVTSSWTTTTDWTTTNEYEPRLIKTSGSPTEWLYKAGLWIELTDLQKALVMYRVGGYSSVAATTNHSEQGAVINTSYFAGVTGSRTVGFEASGREPTVGTSDLTLYTINGSGSIGSSNLNFNSATKSRMRATGLSVTDGDRFTVQSNRTSGTIESSGGFVIIQTQ
jgi:hypothetical protein